MFANVNFLNENCGAVAAHRSITRKAVGGSAG